MEQRSLFTLTAFVLLIFLSACGQTTRPIPDRTVPAVLPSETTKPAGDPSALPDLVVSYVNIAMQGVPVYTTKCVTAYTPYEVRAKIENRGTAKATEVQVYELSTRYTISIGELPAGICVEVIIPLESPNGAYHISVDPQNIIPETDESNNTADYLAITPTPPILCQSTPPAGTPFPDSSPSPILWKTYRNDLYGFSFEYPAIYEELKY